MKAAGAVLVGALNMDEYAYGFTTENTHYGPTCNPHDVTRISGGSSGGNLASIVGTAPAATGESVSSRVRAVIDFYGASDMLTMPVNVPGPGKTDADLATSNGAKLLGGIVRDRADRARQVSPP